MPLINIADVESKCNHDMKTKLLQPTQAQMEKLIHYMKHKAANVTFGFVYVQTNARP
jgi:hypothetical protein